jgi:hypothetical protein
MKALAVLALVLSIPAFADPSPTAKRDAALQEIHSCLKSNNVSSRQCKGLNANVQALVEVYRNGDKSVLPTLFMFPYLTDFYGDALLSDAEGFLTALSLLPQKDEKAVANGLAGGMFFLRTKDRFERIVAALRNPSESPVTQAVAQLCLREVEQRNASFIISYFPPETFTGRASDFTERMFASAMYALGEKPLWPTSVTNESIYRLTLLPAFGDAIVVSLTVAADDNGKIATKSMNRDEESVTTERASDVPSDNVVRFLSALDQAHFWQGPAELPSPPGRIRLDGAEWILEGVRDGNYHVAIRWRPDIERQDADETHFAYAGQLLFELAGHNHR